MPHFFNEPHPTDDKPRSSFELWKGAPSDGFFDKRFWVGLLCGVGLTFLSLMILGYMTIHRISKRFLIPIETRSTKQVGEPKSSQPPVKLSWSGKGMKTTDFFTIDSGKWRICWSTKPNPSAYGLGHFAILVRDSHGMLVKVCANVFGPDTDCSYVHTKGTYYLEITGTQPWDVRVESE